MRGACEQEAFIEAFIQWVHLDGIRVFATRKAAGYGKREGNKSVRIYLMVPFFDSFFGQAKKE